MGDAPGSLLEMCGGRSLNDDVMDTLYTLLINAGNGPRVSDGMDRATVPASDVFPYLESPNPPPPTGQQIEDITAFFTQQTEAPQNPPPQKRGRP